MTEKTKYSSCHANAGWNLVSNPTPIMSGEIPDQVWDDRGDVAIVEDNFPVQDNASYCHSSASWNLKQERGLNHKTPDQVWGDESMSISSVKISPHCHSSVGWNLQQEHGLNHKTLDQVWGDEGVSISSDKTFRHCHSSVGWNLQQEQGLNHKTPNTIWDELMGMQAQ